MANNLRNCMELDLFLQRYLNARFTLDKKANIDGMINGFIDGQRILINFEPNRYLIVSVKPEAKKLLDELLPLLKVALNSIDPICSYDFQVGDDQTASIMEWNFENPEGRLNDIATGRAFVPNYYLKRFKLYGKGDIAAFQSNNRISFSRIHGIYPGLETNVDYVNSLSEVDLYFAIDAVEKHIEKCQHDMAYNSKLKIDLTEQEYFLDYMIYLTTKFGVKLPAPEEGKRIQITMSYNAWFNFYANHFNNVLTEEQWWEFCAARRSGNDISSYLPKGHWTDSLGENIPPKR